MSWLQLEIERALEGRNIVGLAKEWNIPRWVIDDLRHDRLKMPGGPYLAKIASGLGMTTDELLLRLTPPPEDNGRTPGGDPSGRTSVTA